MPNELNLNTKVEVLVVTIEDKTYNIPLATSLPLKKAKGLMRLTSKSAEEQFDAFVEFFKEYIDADVVDNLPISALSELAKAWNGANGDSLGES